MAIDEHLLEQAQANPNAIPVLRLYRWSRPTLSLGYHQRVVPPHWRELAADGVIDLIRRPSGGRAVLHGGDLSYALIWPAATGHRRLVYSRACGWLCRTFTELGLPVRFGQSAPSRDRASCFATSTAADLVHADGSKRIGSAQLWRRGDLLQHGSILLNPPAPLWRLIFREDPPVLSSLPLRLSALERLLEQSAARCLPMARGGVNLVHHDLDGQEWEAVEALIGRHGML